MFIQKLKDYQQLVKLNLSLLVIASALAGYIIVPENSFSFLKLFWLFLGGMLVTGAANASNQLLEIESDKVMKRTQERPMPDMRLSKMEAIVFVILALSAGCFILFKQFNFLTCVIAFVSYGLYTFAYTPLKKISPVSVLVGAIPGSLPCLIGWAAATNNISTLAAWTLFIIQFFWQFPHFWSIAWLAHEDYNKAGMKMLPKFEKQGAYTAFQCLMYSAVLLPLSALPMQVGLGGYISLVGLVLAALWMCYNSYLFVKDNSDANARKVMFASFVYLPIVLISLIIDRFV